MYKVAVPLTRREVLLLTLHIAVIYFSYNAFLISALQYTAASGQTVIDSTTAVFTLATGALLDIDYFTSKKIFCVVTSLIGVILISVLEKKASENTDSKFEPKNPMLGNSFALLCAFSYGLYLIVMKVKCGLSNKTTYGRKLFG